MQLCSYPLVLSCVERMCVGSRGCVQISVSCFFLFFFESFELPGFVRLTTLQLISVSALLLIDIYIHR